MVTKKKDEFEFEESEVAGPILSDREVRMRCVAVTKQYLQVIDKVINAYNDNPEKQKEFILLKIAMFRKSKQNNCSDTEIEFELKKAELKLKELGL